MRPSMRVTGPRTAEVAQHGFNEHLALDHRAGGRPAAVRRRGKISELMGDFAKGIKSFKKGIVGGREGRGRAAKPDPMRRSTISRRRRPRRRARRSQAALRRRPASPARSAESTESPGRHGIWKRGVGQRRPFGVEGSMFDIGWCELLVIGIVALIVIGPKELPGALRTLGQWMGKIRRMAAEFQGQFQEAMREAEIDRAQEGHRRHGRQGQELHPFRSDRGRAQGHREVGRATCRRSISRAPARRQRQRTRKPPRRHLPTPRPPTPRPPTPAGVAAAAPSRPPRPSRVTPAAPEPEPAIADSKPDAGRAPA